MKRLIAFLTAGLLLAAGPAFAGIAIIAGTGTGGALANLAFNAGASVGLTTTVLVPAGSLVIASAQGTNGAQDFGCSDTVGNTYTAGQSVSTITNANSKLIYSLTTNAIPNGSTITCSVTSGGNGITAMVVAFSGASIAPYDSASAPNKSGTGTGTITTGPTGTLNGPCGSANCELLIGSMVTLRSGATTSDATYTNLGSGNFNIVNYKIVSATTAQSWSPSTVAASGAYAAQLEAFKAAPPAGAMTCVIGSGVMGC